MKWIFYALSIERVLHWTVHRIAFLSWKFWHFFNYVMLVWKIYQSGHTHSHSWVRESGNEAMHVQKPGGGEVLRTRLLLGTGLWEVKLHDLLNSAWLYHDVTSISEHVVPQEICMAGYFLCERVGIQLCSQAQAFAYPMHNYIHGHEYI